MGVPWGCGWGWIWGCRGAGLEDGYGGAVGLRLGGGSGAVGLWFCGGPSRSLPAGLNFCSRGGSAMGPHVLVLGFWVLGLCGATDRQPQLQLQDGPWARVGDTLHLHCSGPGPHFQLLHGNGSSPVKTITSHGGFATFRLPVAAPHDGGLYTCRCWDPPGPPSEPVEVLVIDPNLAPPKLSLPQPLPQPLPRGSNVSVVCEGPPGAGTVRLYREGGRAAVRRRWGALGGAVPLPLGPLLPSDQGTYVCLYSPEGGGVSSPSPPLLLLVEGGEIVPVDPDWEGCGHWRPTATRPRP
ncbi:immunoglobulin superfamily member 1-like [Phalacrocorax carbo]|uniref:immunoglobulin superfamily member 1-like n=1 Tax=Phalacrocorax carbo TaxID=9209 RepID=UPI00311920F3